MTGLAITSSPICYQWTYDVFINFRGEDSRHGFTGNLYNALKNRGIHTFIDDEELRKGDKITPTLLKAIENSRMAITVFSKDYASSAFCLNELVQIHHCILGKGGMVLPIFYDVAPSEVRHQKGSYNQALSMHIKNLKADEDKIQSWKLALHEVSNISGFHFSPRQNRYEYLFIEMIVKEISRKIDRVPLHVVARYPVGLESRVKRITSLLQIGSNEEAIMVGICGIGGIGKTTIARAVYNSVADNFEGMCFYHDIKEDSRKLGLARIQETIISEIVGVDIKIQDVNKGVELIKMKLRQKKIFMILDNVDKHEQLEKLAGDCYWFSGGSRMIITTRDKHLLVRHGIERIYNMEALNAQESLELLSWNAFKSDQIKPSYMNVLNRAVIYAQGLPLALEVIGSNLCGRTIDEWESLLDAYKLIPNEGIQQVLKMSYEGLDQVEKEIFLDITCFFKGKYLKEVKYMVEVAHGFNNLSYFIRALVDKCLINIENDDRIEMHDLIRDMGREIVRQEQPKKPGKRSRLWFHQDIVDVLEENRGTDEVRMIIQDNSSKCIEVNWDGEAFKSMKKLEILIFENVKFSESPKYLPNSLKVLKWKGYPYSYLPPNFCPKKLVMLDIGHGYLSLLDTTQTWDNLSILNLGGCEYVIEIPDLSNVRKLKELDLFGCKNLVKIHDSIGYLPKLENLYLNYCVRLKTFPRAIKLPCLRELNLCGCSSLKYFPEILEKVKIRDLCLYETGIEKLPWSICNLFELRRLWMGQSRQVIEIPNCIFLLPELEMISIDGNDGKVIISSKLKEGQEHAIWFNQCDPNRVIPILKLPRCNISDDVLRTYPSGFINVVHLDLTGNNFTILPVWIQKCQFLRFLKLNECKHLREVEGIPPNIQHLGAINCLSLSSEAKSLLLSEELHGDPGRYDFLGETRFYVPSRRIPKWFEHKSKGASISFWFCNSFPPALCMCILFKPRDAVFHPKYSHSSSNFDSWLYINDEVAQSFVDSQNFDDDHLVVYYLKEDHIPHNKIERLCQKNQWNHARIHISASVQRDGPIIEEMGMYVIKPLCEIEDITFTNPYHQTLDSTWGNRVPQSYHQTLDSTLGILEQAVITRMEEKELTVNKKRGLMGDDNFASSSTAFICTKRARNSSINQENNDAIIPQVPFVKALEIINNNPVDQQGMILKMMWLSLRPCWRNTLL